MSRRRAGGFTIIELIVVIVIAGILASMIGSFILRPIQGSVQLSKRAGLVDQADLSLRRMARDIRKALPNSVRVSANGDAIEFLAVADAATYRSTRGNNIPLGGSGNHNSAADQDWLDFSGDSRFNILGSFKALVAGYGSNLPSGTRLAIYSTDPGETYADAAANGASGVITPADTAIELLRDDDEDQLALSSPFTFRYSSPAQRVYVVDGPVSYICSGGQLYRYAGYAVQAVQPTAADLSGGVLLADKIASCDGVFRYAPGTPARAALATLRLRLADGDAGRVELLRQVHVENAP